MSESNENKHDEAIKDAETWIEKYAIDTDNIEMKMKTYFTSAYSNILSENGNKELGMQHLNRCSYYFVKDTTAHFYWHFLPNIYYEYCKYKGNGYLEAIYATRATITHFLKYYKTNLKEINANKQTNSSLNFYFGFLPFVYIEHYKSINNAQWTNNQIKMLNLTSILAAKLGSQQAKDYCNECKIDYKKPLTKKEMDFVGIEEE